MPGPKQLSDILLDISIDKKVVYNYFIRELKSDLQRKIRYLSQFNKHQIFQNIYFCVNGEEITLFPFRTQPRVFNVLEKAHDEQQHHSWFNEANTTC